MRKHFDTGDNLDSAEGAAYTMEFLDSPKKFTEGRDSHMDKKDRVLQEEVDDAPRRIDEDHRAH